jgi:charged multivesicular body protein 4
MSNILAQDELKLELDELEQEELNDRMRGAEHVPLHVPETTRVEESEFYYAFLPSRLFIGQ